MLLWPFNEEVFIIPQENNKDNLESSYVDNTSIYTTNTFNGEQYRQHNQIQRNNSGYDYTELKPMPGHGFLEIRVIDKYTEKPVEGYQIYLEPDAVEESDIARFCNELTDQGWNIKKISTRENRIIKFGTMSSANENGFAKIRIPNKIPFKIQIISNKYHKSIIYDEILLKNDVNIVFRLDPIISPQFFRLKF
jgi:hypothetical protein